MSAHILFCPACGRFTLSDKCPECRQATVLPHPPKYSPEDAYASYRRKAKRPELEAKGLL